MNNLERYKNDLEKLIETGETLLRAMHYECDPEGYRNRIKKRLKDETSEFLDSLPDFFEEYQTWYSEAKALIRQLLPDRLDDFVDHYEKPKTRKDLTYESYRISDYVRGLYVTGDGVKPRAAISRFNQQLAIVKAARNRFESLLFDIKQFVQADLFDSELEAAMELVEQGFLRAGGAMAGVVMEKHLAEVCRKHGIRIRKKNPTIATFNDALKEAEVIDIPEWRFNEHLGDLRNLCDHKKKKDPSKDQVTDLINGVMKVTKTLF